LTWFPHLKGKISKTECTTKRVKNN